MTTVRLTHFLRGQVDVKAEVIDGRREWTCPEEVRRCNIEARRKDYEKRKAAIAKKVDAIFSEAES